MERAVGGTRAELLRVLRRGDRSIAELATALGISTNAVRMHVAGLERDRLVEIAGLDRGTGGKPAQTYRMTAEAEELFPKAYALVLGELVRVLEYRGGREEAVGLLREVGARAARALPEGGSAGGRVKRAAEVLRELGGDVEVHPEGDGWFIRGWGCPLSAVTSEHADVCQLAVALIEEVTGERVVECCDRGERPRCAFRVGG